MTVLNKTDLDPATLETTVTDETYTKAAQTAADEEELMMRRSDSGEASEDTEAEFGDGSGEFDSGVPVVGESDRS
jgi:hypothetical protein